MRVGLIGFPVKHSISPRFQQAAFDAAGFPARYEAWEVPPDSLGDVVASLRSPDSLGANVTIPHKQAVRAFLDRIDPVAEAIGAVNTIVREANHLVGYNTDATGFARSVNEDAQTDLAGKTIGVVGAGGAARAVVAAILAEGATSIYLAARRIEQARDLVRDLSPLNLAECSIRPVVLEESPRWLAEVAVLVNTTPIGMAHRADEGKLPIQVDVLRAGALVCDLIYNPAQTALLAAAASRGARTLNGLPMLVYQGAAAWELWTGRAAPVELMRRAALEALNG